MKTSSLTNGFLARLRWQSSPANRNLLLLWFSTMILTPYALQVGSQPALALTLTLSTIAQAGLVLGLPATTWNTTRVVASGQRVADAFGLPASVLLMTCSAGRALWWRFRYGGPVWKGRRAVA